MPLTVQLPPGTHQVSEDQALADLARARGQDTSVSAGTAATIAAWWHSPGRIGRHLATLSSGLPVSLDDLVSDIDATAGELDPLAFDDRAGLTHLKRWAITTALASIDEERAYLANPEPDDLGQPCRHQDVEFGTCLTCGETV